MGSADQEIQTLWDGLVDNYVERTPRCRAVQVRYDNLWRVSELLHRSGLQPKVDPVALVMDVFKDNLLLFTVNVKDGDAILLHNSGPYIYEHDVALVSGPEFRRIWEKDIGE